MDISSVETGYIEPGQMEWFNTGLRVTPPAGHYCRLASRSGLLAANRISVEGGVIDPDYTGPIKVCLRNGSRKTYLVLPGERIAQLICERASYVEVAEVVGTMPTRRDGCGFGSSGL